jgi:protease-4
MSSKRSGCLWVIFSVALFVSVVMNLALLISNPPSTQTAASVAELGSSPFHFLESVVRTPNPEKQGHQKRVLVLALGGVISSFEPGEIEDTSLEDLLAKLRHAAADETISSVVLRIDSPGGEVTASDILYDAVRRLREKKPVVVTMDSVAASGGYYVACAGSHLFAHETTLTASIGVIMQSLNYQHLFGKIGLEMHTFKSGSLKDMLNGARELSEDERAYVQSMIMESYDRFVGIVARERHLDERALRQGVADGRVVSGKKALEEHLIDEIGGFEEALEKAKSLAQTPGAGVIRYTAPVAFGRLFRLLSEAPLRGARVELGLGLGGRGSEVRLESGRLYYLPSFFAF